jgi:multisubunit Na+/H+ antiporter MnhF subunit
MNEWEIAAAVLGFALVPCLAVCFVSSAARGLPAFELAGVLLSTILMLLAEGFHRQPFIDLAVVFAPMSLVGGLAFARLMEHGIEQPTSGDSR